MMAFFSSSSFSSFLCKCFLFLSLFFLFVSSSPPRMEMPLPPPPGGDTEPVVDPIDPVDPVDPVYPLDPLDPLDPLNSLRPPPPRPPKCEFLLAGRILSPTFGTLVRSVQTCEGGVGKARLTWNYTNYVLGYNGSKVILSSGDPCKQSIAKCGGGFIQFRPNIFTGNSYLLVYANLTFRAEDENSVDTQSFLGFYPVQDELFFIHGGFSASNLSTLVVNPQTRLLNAYQPDKTFYSYSCTLVTSGGDCPVCPTITETEAPLRLTIEGLPLQSSEECTYKIDSTLFLTKYDEEVVSLSTVRTFKSSSSRFFPPLDWTARSLVQCEVSPSGSGIPMSLTNFGDLLPEEFYVSSYEWVYIPEGGAPEPGCNDEIWNCGGNTFSGDDIGNDFMYIPAAPLQSCTRYTWGVNVTVQNKEVEGEKGRSYTPLKTCAYFIAEPPSKGNCSIGTDRLIRDSDNCNGLPGREIEITCEGFFPGCGSDGALSYSVVETSQTGDIYERAISYERIFSVRVGEDMDIYVRVCDGFGSCVNSDTIRINICEIPQGAFEKTLEAVERCMSVGDVACAQYNQLILVELLAPCDNDFNSNETTIAIEVADELFDLWLEVADGNPRNLPDLTTLFQVWLELGEKSCEPLPNLFENLLEVCQGGGYSGAIASGTLDSLLTTLRSFGDDDYFGNLDTALLINECYQFFLPLQDCGDKTPVAFDGNEFGYIQEVFSLQDLQAGFAIDFGSGKYYFPSNFDQQLSTAYEVQFGEVGDFSCAIFNLITTSLSDTSNISFAASMTGITVRFIEEESNGFPVASSEIQLNNLQDVYLEIFVDPDTNGCSDSENTRFGLSNEGIDTSNIYTPTFYSGDGVFTTDGVVPVNSTCYSAFARVEHFSNFGLLFSTSSAEDWTTLRILSVALFAASWFLIISFCLLVTFSQSFRFYFRLRTASEKNSFILGDNL